MGLHTELIRTMTSHTMCGARLMLSIFLYGFCSLNGAAEADAANKNNRKNHHRKTRTKEEKNTLKCSIVGGRRSAVRCIHAKLATTITHISLSNCGRDDGGGGYSRSSQSEHTLSRE